MASVIVRPVRVVPEPPREYVLTLSRDEAQALLDLTYCIGGPPSGPRGFFTDSPDSLFEVLTSVGLKRSSSEAPCHGAVVFDVRT